MEDGLETSSRVESVDGLLALGDGCAGGGGEKAKEILDGTNYRQTFVRHKSMWE
jgi:hypothetical protein